MVGIVACTAAASAAAASGRRTGAVKLEPAPMSPHRDDFDLVQWHRDEPAQTPARYLGYALLVLLALVVGLLAYGMAHAMPGAGAQTAVMRGR